MQAAVEDALRLAGFDVWHTSAFRQRGPSGVSPGVPDLLVAHPCVVMSLLGIEVKRPGGRLSPAQRDLVERGYVAVATSPAEALEVALAWLRRSPGATVGAVRRAESVLEALDRG